MLTILIILTGETPAVNQCHIQILLPVLERRSTFDPNFLTDSDSVDAGYFQKAARFQNSCLSIYLSIYLSIPLSVYLSIFLSAIRLSEFLNFGRIF